MIARSTDIYELLSPLDANFLHAWSVPKRTSVFEPEPD
jgi:hypothetical protein